MIMERGRGYVSNYKKWKYGGISEISRADKNILLNMVKKGMIAMR